MSFHVPFAKSQGIPAANVARDRMQSNVTTATSLVTSQQIAEAVHQTPIMVQQITVAMQATIETSIGAVAAMTKATTATIIARTATIMITATIGIVTTVATRGITTTTTTIETTAQMEIITSTIETTILKTTIRKTATHKTIIRTTPTIQTILETVVIIEITMAVTELVTHRQISRLQDSRNNMISINKDSTHRHIIPKHTV